MRATAIAEAARVMLPVGNGRLSLHVPRIIILPALVMPTMGGSTIEVMMIPVLETTAGETGIATETEIETGTGIGTGSGDITGEMTTGHPGTTTVQTVLPRVEETTVAVEMTTEVTDTGNGGGVGTVTVTIIGPEIATMTDDMLPQPIVLHHSVIITTNPALLAEPNQRIHLAGDGRLLLEAQETGLVDRRPCLMHAMIRRIPIHLAIFIDYRKVHLLKVLAQSDIHDRRRALRGDVPESVKLEDQPVEGAIVMDGQMDVEMTTETIVKEEDRSDNQDGEIHGKAGPSSPVECQQPSIPSPEIVAGPSKEASVTQPYLPAIPRYDAKPRFSAAYESEYNRLEAHRAHAATECRRCFKASRRAFHELEMTTLDLRAAQLRRELAESHRKKAHHGQLGIDAESAVNK
ncbi:hypothetical protein V8E55_011362 [Tylopilus felleus]